MYCGVISARKRSTASPAGEAVAPVAGLVNVALEATAALAAIDGEPGMFLPAMPAALAIGCGGVILAVFGGLGDGGEDPPEGEAKGHEDPERLAAGQRKAEQGDLGRSHHASASTLILSGFHPEVA